VCVAKIGKLNLKPISEFEIRKLLSKLDVQSEVMGITYLFFAKNPDMLLALLVYALENRKDRLHHMLLNFLV